MRCAICFFLLAAAHSLRAGYVHAWTIGEIEDAPALVVATIESVVAKEPIPSSRSRSRLPERYVEVALRVHRSYSRLAIPRGTLLGVRYVSYDGVQALASGYPIWPRFEAGMTALFALAPTDGARWSLVANEGVNLTVPAILNGPLTEKGTRATGRSFIVAELANAMANGVASDRYASAGYLGELFSGWPDGLREQLDRSVRSDDQWLEIGCALLASRAYPQTSVDALMTQPGALGPRDDALAWVLKRGAKRDYPTRLIRTLLNNSPFYEWGAASALIQFKDSAELVTRARALLQNDPNASIYLAWTLVRNGQSAILPEALRAAARLISGSERLPAPRYQAACGLLRDYGTDREFDLILSTLRRFKAEDQAQYTLLLQAVDNRQSKRLLGVAEILIDDKRPGFGQLRYCDVAAAMVAAVSGEDFGLKLNTNMDTAAWDGVVDRAAAWLRTRRTR